MDGFEVCKRLKQDERTRDIPIIFISALQEVQDRVQGFEAGGVDFITKPFQEEEVLARVRTHVELRNMQLHLEDLVEKRTAEIKKLKDQIEQENIYLRQEIEVKHKHAEIIGNWQSSTRDGVPQGCLFVELQGSKPGKLLGQIDSCSLRSDPRLGRHHEPCQGRRRIGQGLHLWRALFDGRRFRFHPSQTRVALEHFFEQQPKLDIGHRSDDFGRAGQPCRFISIRGHEARCQYDAGNEQCHASS